MNSDDTVEPVDVEWEPVENAEEPLEDTARAAKSAKRRQASPGARLARLLGIHAMVAILALSVFAAADAWNTVTGLKLAGVLCFITAIIAGVTLTTLIHEWFHLIGARFSNGAYTIPTRTGLFLYDWDYSSNNQRQFFIMSIAGSVGGVLAVILLWNSVPADSWGRAALRGAAVASFVYAACIEWPVLNRTRSSKDPLGELSKIDRDVLSRSFIISGITGLILTFFLAP